jgi:hypothetical protein
MINDQVLRNGLHVSKETVWDLIKGYTHEYDVELFAKENGSLTERPLQTQGLLDSGVNDLFISPDGRYVIFKTDTIEVPQSWSQYEDLNVQMVFRIKLRKGFGTRILRHEIVDTRTGKSEVLLDSPATYARSDVLWSPDSKSVLLCGVYLPLNVGDQSELQSRRSTKFVAEIDLRSRTVTKVTHDDLTPIGWDPQTNIVQFSSPQKQHQSNGMPDVVTYKKSGKSWERLKADSTALNHNLRSILLQQDLNLPPRVIAVDPQTKQKVVLLDLNQQFARLAFGDVQELHWTDGSGNPVDGGLYLPPDYVAGRRYPLVIQTHGFDPHVFRIDGPYTTAFAAQPLANKGIIVLQVEDIFSGSLQTTQEAERAMRAYENAVEYLNRKGMIDRSRVGLIGFSRTCLYVKYTLTHSSQHFAAAIAADGYDGGYLQYLVSRGENANADFDTVMGARPFGAGLQVWLRQSPGFTLDKVQTPILLQALTPGNLLGEWEWFSGLRLLDKPVDLVYVPTGTHMLVKPWDRRVSQEGSVDWFCFWLKGEEDPDPAKADQYVRWRWLRKLQEENEKKAARN